MRDQNLKKIFVIHDARISRDTWRASKWNLNIRDSWCVNFTAREPWQRTPVQPSLIWGNERDSKPESIIVSQKSRASNNLLF